MLIVNNWADDYAPPDNRNRTRHHDGDIVDLDVSVKNDLAWVDDSPVVADYDYMQRKKCSSDRHRHSILQRTFPRTVLAVVVHTAPLHSRTHPDDIDFSVDCTVVVVGVNEPTMELVVE